MFKLRKYHSDRVQSLTYEGEDKSFSVGILTPGEYEFGAIKKEVITVTSGKIIAWAEGSDKWKTCNVGETFEVEAHKNFKQKVDEVSSYICYYV